MKRNTHKKWAPLVVFSIFILLFVIVMLTVVTRLHLPSEKEAIRHETAVSETESSIFIAAETTVLEQAVETAASEPTSTLVPTAVPQVVSIPAAEYFNSHTSQEEYMSWIRKLSGAEPVTIDGQETTIATRYSYAMFANQDNAKAEAFLLEQIGGIVPASAITVEPFTFADGSSNNTWENIVVTFPGQTNPDEQILYTAHYDSCVALTNDDPLVFAPGANDNGTGVAALMEALKTFSKTTFDRTVKVVFFSGEENFMQGSKAYIEAHSADHIVGVINVDMFGYDGDGDRCFEIHVGAEGSDALGQAVIQAIDTWQLNLRYDYITYRAMELSDYYPFYMRQIPTVMIEENFLDATSEGGCVGKDPTPNWHLPSDTVDDVMSAYAFDISRAATLAVLSLAGANPIVME